jgi:hypothetical protein
LKGKATWTSLGGFSRAISRYCSNACRQRALRNRKHAPVAIKIIAAIDGREPLQNSQNKPAKTTGCDREIRGRGWLGPADVIGVTLVPGDETVGVDGVRCVVTQLARSVLVDGH